MPSIAVGADDEEEEAAEAAVEEEEEDGDDDEDGEKGQAVAERAAKEKAASAAPALRVLFLDVDGVLNTRPDPRLMLVEGGPCAQLRRLLAASGARLVLTSRWKRHHEYVAEVLANFGVFGDRRAGEPPPALERTRQHGDGSRRDLEMLHWLGARRGLVGAWAALDASDLLRWPSATRLQGHVVRVRDGAGLGPADVEAALRALGCASSSPPVEGQLSGDGVAPAALSSGGGLCGGSCGDGFAPLPRNSQLARAAADKSLPNGIFEAFRAATSWDSELSEKMTDLLGALGKSGESTAALHKMATPGWGPAVSATYSTPPLTASRVKTTSATLDARLADGIEALMSSLQSPSDGKGGASTAVAKLPVIVHSAAAVAEARASAARSNEEFDALFTGARARFKE